MTTLTAEPAAEMHAPTMHPLDPLTCREMERAVEVLRRSGRLGARARFVEVE